MLTAIVFYTNIKIDIRERYNGNCRYIGSTDNLEIRALIDLLYIAGCQKDGHLSTSEMWSVFGPEIYKCIMTKARFEFLITCLRFDDRTTRHLQDKFAPIKRLWTSFISHSTEYYNRNEYCTVDEQLLDFRGKCPFRVYIASKPDKYGIKMLEKNFALLKIRFLYTTLKPYLNLFMGLTGI